MQKKIIIIKRWWIFISIALGRTLRADWSLLSNALMGLLTMTIVHGLQLSATWALLSQLSPESLFPYLGQQGALLVAWGFIGIAADGLRRLPLTIENGEFESCLGAPLPPLLLAALSASSVISFTDLLLGMILIILTAQLNINAALIALICIPMEFFVFTSLFILGGAASLRMRRGGAVGDFLVFTTLTLSSFPSVAGFQGKSRLLLFLSPALFTAYLPFQSLNAKVNLITPTIVILIATFVAILFMFFSIHIFSLALKKAEFSSLVRMRH
ncbi:MAG: ABC-2 family transporter protein [Oligoflexia bacterium]|nr:ABC-2 family transporter protein [Oligoflexia bacterium]MBF0366978.1 ABC-2 family transporter protein [Oligoflexia bacterium]